MSARPVHRGVILVLPRRRAEGSSIAALWTLTAGWATSARERFGHSWIVTREGIASPEEALSFAEAFPARRRSVPSTFQGAPVVLRTAVKDVLRARDGHAARDIAERREWRDHEIVFVWQHHDLFQSPGVRLARRHRCPLVLFVDAPQVWEARRWGVSRPGWGRFVEKYGEKPQLLASDVVACVSDEVAREVQRFGVRSDRIVVSPMAVDTDLFTPARASARDLGRDSAEIRHSLGLGDAFVVGWAGTFRRFQGLDVIVEAFGRFRRTHSAARLLLVGDGAERGRIEQLSERTGVGDAVVFTGALPPRKVPAHLRVMDVAVVSAQSSAGFHYSPIKLREYLACGRATVAPRVGEIPGFVTDGVHARLYAPGDALDLASRLGELADDSARRARLGSAGRALVLRTATWDVRLSDLVGSTPFRTAVGRWSCSP